MNQVMNSILSRLNGVKPCGNGWKALCPAHDDQKQSLQTGSCFFKFVGQRTSVSSSGGLMVKAVG
jgi:hypothetical protein